MSHGEASSESTASAAFAVRWAAKERAVGSGLPATPMVTYGSATIPRDAAPFLSFRDAEAPQSVWDLYQLPESRFGEHRERLSRFTVIGSDGAGNPICVRSGSSHVVMLDHEIMFESETFVNSSIEQLAECLLAYLGERDPERFRSAVNAIDAPAIADQTFWWFEIEDLIHEAQAQATFAKTPEDQALRSRMSPLRRLSAWIVRPFGR
jgi:hypothetical protein